MEILIKVGDKRHQSDPAFAYDFRDGQIINIRPNGYYTGLRTKKHHCVITTQHDYWQLMGTTDLKNPTSQTYAMKKYINGMHQGKKKWEFGYVKPNKFIDYRNRDYFIDFKWMLQQGWITKLQYDSIYDKSKNHNHIYIDRDLSTYFFHEDIHYRETKTAMEMEAAVGTISAGGTYTVGTGQDYADWSDAIADLPADIGAMFSAGNITLQGNTTEEISEGAAMVISLDTDIYTLTLTVASSHVHNGGAYGSGHRINFGTFDEFEIDEAAAGTTNNVIIQDFAIDARGASNIGVLFTNGGDSGHLIVERSVVKGDANTTFGFGIFYNSDNGILRNNICYGCTQNAADKGYGIWYNNQFAAGKTYDIYNNTCNHNYHGIGNDKDDLDGTITIKNNIAMGNTGDDYVSTSSMDTTTKNISGDATSPDAAYQNFATTSAFTDYSNNDYRLTITNTTLDDGDDLSGIGAPEQFSNDIQQNTRTTWYIGASEFSGISAPTVNEVENPANVNTVLAANIENVNGVTS